MLTTDHYQRLEVQPSPNGPDSTTWRAVNLELFIPYAFISHSIKEGSSWLARTTIFWIEDDILDFCRALRGNRKWKIFDVSLLLPSDSMNDRFGRRWVQIAELWSCRTSASTVTYPVYVSVEKETIGEVDGATGVMTGRDAELLYRLRRNPRPNSNNAIADSTKPKKVAI